MYPRSSKSSLSFKQWAVGILSPRKAVLEDNNSHYNSSPPPHSLPPPPSRRSHQTTPCWTGPRPSSDDGWEFVWSVWHRQSSFPWHFFCCSSSCTVRSVSSNCRPISTISYPTPEKSGSRLDGIRRSSLPVRTHSIHPTLPN